MKPYIIKVEQYINKWVTLIESKVNYYSEEIARDIQKQIMDHERVELKADEKFITITVANGPVRISIKEAYFKNKA